MNRMNGIRIKLILFSLFITGITCYSQSPNLISYQTVIRNGNNELVSNTTIGVRISILGGPEANVLVYQEEHTVKTNLNGLAYLTIGNGKILNGLITSIDWSKGPYFIKSETDPTGGKNYTIVVLSQMLSVPYAIYSSTAEKLIGTLPENDPVFNGSISKGITAIDTSYWNRKLNTFDTSGMLVNYRTGLNQKLNITDTSKMLLPYLRVADTTNMLSNYRTSINNKLDAKDTTLMLSHYLKKSERLNEIDPIFSSSISKGITATDTSYWNRKLNITDTIGMFENYIKKQSFPQNSKNGDILFYYSNKWVNLEKGKNGQVLTLIDDLPKWSGTAYPTITTNIISNITTTTATSGGNITADGGAAVTTRGVVWSTSPTPTISLSTKTSDGSGTGSFTSALTGLSPNTTYYVRAFASNSAGTGYGNEITFTTSTPVVLPTVSTISASSITITSATSGGNITADGGAAVTTRGVVWSSSSSPTVSLSTKTINGTGIGSFSSAITGLSPSTTYYVRAYATNSAGTGYGNEITFTTSSPVVPTVSTISASSITITSATSGGNITADGGAAVTTRGVVWSSSSSPTVSLSTKTSNGTGIGSFSSALSGLSPSTTYYVRAYATNSAGTGYGNEITFTTSSPVVPTVSTISASSITITSATSGGNITADGGAAVTTRGVVWSTSPNPTISLSTKTSDGSGTVSFTSALSGLSPSTTYYVRAFATNSAGTGYGNEITFSTTSALSQGIPCPGTSTVKDIDDNIYNTVKIGTQCWTKENLKVTKYRDGSLIPLDETGGTSGNGTGQTWSSRTTGVRTVYGHNATNFETYGYLYNWYAVNDSRGLCPTGWHVPSSAEWTVLIDQLGGLSVAGGKMKVTGTTYWISPNTGATNGSGFGALPGGDRDYDAGQFGGIKNLGYFWSSTDADQTIALRTVLYNESEFAQFGGDPKRDGFSIRCLKDTTLNIVNVVPILNTIQPNNLLSTSAKSGGSILNDGGAAVTTRGVVWSTSLNPTISLSTKTSDGSGTGSFTSTLSGLLPSTTYYVRAYATNSAGTGYGNEITFTTSSPVVPIVSTLSASSITITSATSGGNITADGGAAVTTRGVVWSTSSSPTVSLSTKTSDGSGTGSFTSSLSGLSPSTTYYVRAYATNSAGTGYGNEITFTSTSQVVSDIDGNTYNTVQIGTQVWMSENLKTSKYRQGSSIPNITNNSWNLLSTGAWCYYENNNLNNVIYGKLYNWYSVQGDTICPSGWHVPSFGEFSTLHANLGGQEVAGEKMKSVGTTYWRSPNTFATNETGFSAYPGGLRNNVNSFDFISWLANFWSITEINSDKAIALNLTVLNRSFAQNADPYQSKINGFSIRCLKD